MLILAGFFLTAKPQHLVLIWSFFYSGTPTHGFNFGGFYDRGPQHVVLILAVFLYRGTLTHGWRRWDWRSTKPTSGGTTSRQWGTWRRSSRSRRKRSERTSISPNPVLRTINFIITLVLERISYFLLRCFCFLLLKIVGVYFFKIVFIVFCQMSIFLRSYTENEGRYRTPQEPHKG